jgi:hypothetical protein
MWIAALALPMLMAGCGGGSGSEAGTPVLGGDTNSAVSDLVLQLGSTTLSNNGTDTMAVTVTALDTNRNVVSGATVNLSVDSDAVLNATSTTTSTSGVVSATVSPGSNRADRVVTVTAVSGSIKKTASFQVTGAQITASLSVSVSPGSANNQVVYRVTDVNDNPIANTAISVSAPGFTTVDAVTNSNGSYTYTYTYTAPSTTGSVTLTATAAGVTDTQVIQVLSQDSSIPTAQGVVSSASLSASPNVVAVNTSSTTNQAQLRALFVGQNNLPIQNIRVRFDLNGDANHVGGTIGSGTTMLYSNSSGVVAGSYMPGSQASPTNGVTIRACWDYADFAAGTCPHSTTTTLTVTASPVAVTLGTNELISEGDDKLTYIKQFVVMVVDSSGAAMSGVTVTPLLDLPTFYKGYYTKGATSWNLVPMDSCANEDINRNGVLDALEDVNGNGELDPHKSDASVTVVGSNTTDSTGLVVLQLQYPKNVASWVGYKLSVTASGISGTEGHATMQGILPVAASAITTLSSTPAFVDSPYGMAAGCDNTN